MSESPSNRPQQSGAFSRALLIALMVTVLYGAVLVAIYGFVSLATDTDVVAEPDANRLVGPIMGAVALVIVFLSLLGGLKPRPGPPRIPVGRAMVTAAAVYFLGPATGAIVYSIDREQLFSAVVFAGHHLTSPFVISSALTALVVILLLPVIARAQSAAR